MLNILHQWQESIIISILKPGKDAKHVESYRPISLTFIGEESFRLDPSGASHHLESRETAVPSEPFRDRIVILMKLLNDLHSTRQKKLYVLLVALDISGASLQRSEWA